MPDEKAIRAFVVLRYPDARCIAAGPDSTKFGIYSGKKPIGSACVTVAAAWLSAARKLGMRP